MHQPIEDVDEHQRQLQDEVNQTDMLEQFHEGIDKQERTVETVFFPRPSANGDHGGMASRELISVQQTQTELQHAIRTDCRRLI